jgi:heme/copper-type cytochrome/quinol oxidase subunit 2
MLTNSKIIYKITQINQNMRIMKFIKKEIKHLKDKWNSQKPIQKKFWKWFIVIKIIVFLIVIGLFILFAMKFKQNLW